MEPGIRSSSEEAQILEQGDIYFFYRPKKAAEEVKGIEDVRRFFMITAPEQNSSNESPLYRLLVIGKKSLPEVRETEARASERYWARVGGIFKDPNELTKELSSDEFRKGDAARPVGKGKYAIVKYHNHTDSICTRNTKGTRRSSRAFNETENFVPLSKDTKFIDYQNAQIILIGAREGRDVIKSEIGIEIKEEKSSADIFDKLKLRKEQVSKAINRRKVRSDFSPDFLID